MKFGPEINAFTSHDVTNYMLQAVPVETEANIDSALLILYDWACAVSYDDDEIDKERGVIHEEWRTRRGASFRMNIKTDKVLFEGSKYADRDVIGDINVIDNAPYDELRKFYNDWYRPDLQAIIVIGDFDTDKMEEKIINLFSKIPTKENVKKREFFNIPDNEGTKIAIATDPEARTTNVRVIYKHDPVKDKTTLEYLKKQQIIDLINEMLMQDWMR